MYYILCYGSKNVCAHILATSAFYVHSYIQIDVLYVTKLRILVWKFAPFITFVGLLYIYCFYSAVIFFPRGFLFGLNINLHTILNSY